MRKVVFALVATLAVVGRLSMIPLAQPPAPEAYPGQSEHAKPPADWFCSRHPNVSKDDAHYCDCYRECKEEQNEDGTTRIAPVESNKCKVWCHQDHCSCPTQCDTTH
jgi:hypothetical protein